MLAIETMRGTIEVQLMPHIAPKACENMVELGERGRYDGTLFHRVIRGLMIQGGDPRNGMGESIWGGTFRDEFSPDVTFDRPALLAMANRGRNTNTSHFFITTEAAPWLNRRHTIFGEVVRGYDLVKDIEKVEVTEGLRPVPPQVILGIRMQDGDEENGPIRRARVLLDTGR